jgi:hypothetical protein
MDKYLISLNLDEESMRIWKSIPKMRRTRYIRQLMKIDNVTKKDPVDYYRIRQIVAEEIRKAKYE